jgi:hypothetical protein
LVSSLVWVASSLAAREATSYVQSELGSIATAHSSIVNFLREKSIPVNNGPIHPKKCTKTCEANKIIVALSREDSPIECRVTLQQAPVGSKCIAPCGCTGSQQWITFSEFNRLRRLEPSQWISCQTCQQQFDYSLIRKYGGITGNAVTAILDNTNILRALLTVVAFSTIAGGLGSLIQKLLLSSVLWSSYPKWSKIVHLPLVLKFWGAKLVGQFLLERYFRVEKEILKILAEFETSAVEQNLPVTI